MMERNQKILIVVFFLVVSVGSIYFGGAIIGSDGTGQPESNINERSQETFITIAGSTTVQPVSEILAKVYSRSHPGVLIAVEGGGSGTGVVRAGSGDVSIGASSRPIKDTERLKYPFLVIHKIGGSGVVLIASRSYPHDAIAFEELQALYNDADDDLSAIPRLRDISYVVQRSDPSGTEEVFAKWLFPGSNTVDSSLSVRDQNAEGMIVQMAAEGNAGILKAVKEQSGAVGFVDFGYAEHDPGVKILQIYDMGSTVAVPAHPSEIRLAILNELKGDPLDDDLRYIPDLTRELLYLTDGTPDSEVGSFIRFAQSAEARRYFNEIGYFSMNEIDEIMR
ncbi:MAG: Phosphate-binding protein [Methanomicrobiales archaeon 53_19]|jgi:phosphate transport system substrate-binding protein|uniref:PstS family phosphate ABC transporter substrate-binding protein n=1 Tax=Methanocalculus sp. TaxID=2004547 RepID=UPI00074974C6|nr:PstS family phosphate ABC transporter substrate-binding protein [Methanocalculus sp.]KUK70979.1 MAG: Phosphate-binding protein [Methanocalculus sp. 52_23]KUL04861.1 MAG: Phosphate-binding protein [Methanomicrobiales archaeon 53_19]HIJ06109.1 PstS family phosphate ABC transporter substrate-binding protein [Methanocalculus sp.]